MQGKQRKYSKKDQDDQDVPKAGAQALPKASKNPKEGGGVPSPEGNQDAPKAGAEAQPKASKSPKGGDVVPSPEGNQRPKARAQAQPEASEDRKEGGDVPSPEGSEKLKAGAQAQLEAGEIRKEGGDVPSPEGSEMPKVGAQALPEASENSKEGGDVPSPEESEKPKAGAEAPAKAEISEKSQAGEQSLQKKETEKKEVDGNLQMMEMMKALRDQMSEVSALREQMKKMEVEKREQEEKREKERIEKAARKELKKEAALRKEKENAEEKARAKANPVISSGSDNESESEEEGQSNETPNEEENNENEEEQEDFEDSGEDAYTPVPSSEEEDQSEGEEDADRADRLERKRKGKELRKEAKIAQKVSINMDIEQGKANLKIIEKAEQSIATKLEEAETKLLKEKESRYEKEEALKKKNQVLQKKYDILVRTQGNEMAALLEKQKGKRAVFEESLAKEREELNEDHKKSMNELEGEFNEKKKDIQGVEQLATEVKELELECVILKKSREKKYEEKVKLEKRLAALSNNYESLSLRLQQERKIAKGQEAKMKEEGWSSVVARPKPSPKEEKAVSGPRKIPKHTLPHLAPKERYGENDKMPCPSWLTRVAAGTNYCPVGSNCPEILRGCNLFHKDADMLHAFVRGVRPVGWTEKCEKDLTNEIDYWKGRKDHTFQKLIPEVVQLAPWNKKKDTEEEIENERQRVGRLVEGLSARKRNGPGGPAEGGRGGGRGYAMMANRGGRPRGNFMAQEQLVPPMGQFAAFRGRGNGQKRNGADQSLVVKRGRGRGNGQAQRGAFVALHSQRGMGGGYGDYLHDEQNISYEAVEFTGARQ